MDLSLVPMDELIKEMDTRVDSIIILAHRFSNGEDAYDWHIHGNRIMVLGMVNIAQKHVTGLYDSDESGEFFKD